MIAALFPGQGSQVIGMGQDLYEHSPAARQILDEAEATLPGLQALMWQGPEASLTLTANQQPALVAVGAAAYAAYLESGGRPAQFAAGHSLGEFTAHVAAGSLTLQDALKLVRKRGQYMQEAVPEGQGAMAAVMKLSPESIRDICAATEGIVDIANLNSPQQTVISGEAGAVAAASEALSRHKARVIPLKVSAPFHSSLMKPAASRLHQALCQVSFVEGDISIICNVTAEPLSGPLDAPRLLEEQVTAPVRWTESVQRLATLGVTDFIEFGSGQVLAGLVKRILGDARAVSVTDMKSLREVVR